MEKRSIHGIASTVIVARASNPGQIFVEIKDDGYPAKAFRRKVNVLGGNWIGSAAKTDRHPLDTVRREVEEELTFDRTAASTFELGLLGLQPEDSFYTVARTEVLPNDADHATLRGLKDAIKNRCAPFGDWVHTIPKKVLDASDAENTRDGWISLVSYWIVLLTEEEWAGLKALQDKFGNLSNESVTVMTSLSELVTTRVSVAFGHGRALHAFFRAMGLPQADELPSMTGITSEHVGQPLGSYAAYLERYCVLRHP